MKRCFRATYAVHEIKLRVTRLVVSRNFWYFHNKEWLGNRLRRITSWKQLIQEINSLTLHTLLIYYNGFVIFLPKSFHDIVLLLFYFLYLGSSFLKVIPDSQSFLFTLVNPFGNEPVKMAPKPGATILCWSDVGPTFGNSAMCGDLTVWNPKFPECSPKFPECSSSLALGNGFRCPENVNKNTYFTGASPFQVSELEVFKVNL